MDASASAPLDRAAVRHRPDGTAPARRSATDRHARRRSAPGQAPTSLRSVTRRERLLGWAIVLLFFGGGGLWAWLAPLASAAVAPGVVSPEGKRKTVQHLEGGIIRVIHVREGSRVRAGDALVTLEDVRAHAEYDVLRDQYLALRATVARLEAEQADAPRLTFPEDLAAAGSGGPAQHCGRSRSAGRSRSGRPPEPDPPGGPRHAGTGARGRTDPRHAAGAVCGPPRRARRAAADYVRSAWPSSRRRTTASRSRSRPRVRN